VLEQILARTEGVRSLRGTDEGCPRIRLLRGRWRPLWSRWTTPAASDTRDTTRLADGPPRSARPAKNVALNRRLHCREFDHELLADCYSGAGAVPWPVDSSVAADSSSPRHSSATTYIFKHALVRDAAYQSLLRKIARTCMRTSPPRLKKGFLTRLNPAGAGPRHFDEAGLFESGRYWLRAGRLSAARARLNVEAIAHLRSGS